MVGDIGEVLAIFDRRGGTDDSQDTTGGVELMNQGKEAINYCYTQAAIIYSDLGASLMASTILCTV